MYDEYIIFFRVVEQTNDITFFEFATFIWKVYWNFKLQFLNWWVIFAKFVRYTRRLHSPNEFISSTNPSIQFTQNPLQYTLQLSPHSLQKKIYKIKHIVRKIMKILFELFCCCLIFFVWMPWQKKKWLYWFNPN